MDSDVQSSFLKRAGAFYSAPMSKFIMSLVFYLGLLVVFTYTLAEPFKEMKASGNESHTSFEYGSEHPALSGNEYLYIMWMLVFIIEEVIQLADVKFSLVVYIASIWNVFDVWVSMCFLFYFVFRLCHRPIWARLFLSVNAIPMFVRLIHAGRVLRTTG